MSPPKQCWDGTRQASYSLSAPALPISRSLSATALRHFRQYCWAECMAMAFSADFTARVSPPADSMALSVAEVSRLRRKTRHQPCNNFHDPTRTLQNHHVSAPSSSFHSGTIWTRRAGTLSLEEKNTWFFSLSSSNTALVLIGSGVVFLRDSNVCRLPPPPR